jgi:hypothetical protein
VVYNVGATSAQYTILGELPVANLTTGTNGQVLTMVSGTPAWATSGGSGGSGLIASTLLTNPSGTFITQSTTTLVRVRGVGGGGGAGGVGVASAGQTGASTGGGAGAYIEHVIAVTGSTGYSYTCGAGGAGGVGFANGTSGGNSTFSFTGGPQADGGSGGIGVNPSSTTISNPGGVGGSSGTGNVIVVPGEYGQSAVCVSPGVNNSPIGGNGGSGPFGAGGHAWTDADGFSGSHPGLGYGSGGGGVYNLSGPGAQTGGAGAPGCWIVEEY